MKTSKLHLNNLKVQSFTTTSEANAKAKGGTGLLRCDPESLGTCLHLCWWTAASVQKEQC